MKAINSMEKTDLINTTLTIVFILFWLYAAGVQLTDFNKFRGEMNNQVFSRSISGIMAYALPVIEITIAASLVYTSTRFWGISFSFLLMTAFSIYVGLALMDVYNRMPCNCAGLLGSNSTWQANLIMNLIVTAIAAIGIILNLKIKERRNKVWIP